MMIFSKPGMLWGLVLLIIPILIHLFTSRRHQTLYFSNTANLLNLVEKRRHRKELKHWLLLALRMLGIAALVLAFARPMLPADPNDAVPKERIALFIDNSYSMDVDVGGVRALEIAKQRAHSLIKAHPAGSSFRIVTRNLAGEERRYVDAPSALRLVEAIDFSMAPTSDQEVFAFLKKDGSDQAPSYYWLGDLQPVQGNSGPYPELGAPVHVWPVANELADNLSLDTAYAGAMQAIDDSTFRSSLRVRVRNESRDQSVQTSIQLYLNGFIASQRDIALDGGASEWYELPFQFKRNEAYQGRIHVDDAGLDFDDDLFFASNGYRSPRVLMVGRELDALKVGLEAAGAEWTHRDLTGLNYGELEGYDAVILNELEAVPSGLVGSLVRFWELGHPVVVVPHTSSDLSSYKALTDALHLPSLQGETTDTAVRMDRLLSESPFFSGVFDELPQRTAWPLWGRSMQMVSQRSTEGRGLVFDLAGTPILWMNDLRSAPAYLLNGTWSSGDLFGHGMFPALLYQLCNYRPYQPRLFHFAHPSDVLSWEREQASEQPLALHRNASSYLPNQRMDFNKTRMEWPYHWLKPGIYQVVEGTDSTGIVAVNIWRGEQAIPFESLEQFEERISPIAVLEFNPNTERLQAGMDGFNRDRRSLWWWFVTIAGISLLLEMIIAKAYKP